MLNVQSALVEVDNKSYMPQQPMRNPPLPTVATPQFNFAFNAEDEKNSLALRFARRTETMPQPPKVGHSSVTAVCMAVGCINGQNFAGH